VSAGIGQSRCCKGEIIVSLGRRHWQPRCTGCGHRVTYGEYVPRETRRQPPWTWPGEIRGRHLARAAGRARRAARADAADELSRFLNYPGGPG
jgi:hypothetical protein